MKTYKNFQESLSLAKKAINSPLGSRLIGKTPAGRYSGSSNVGSRFWIR